MAIFKNKNGEPNQNEEDFRFFSQSDADYKIPASRKPIVVKKDKNAKKVSRVVKRAKAAKKSSEKKTTTAAASTETKKTSKKEAIKPVKEVKRAAKVPVIQKPSEQKAAETAKKSTGTSKSATKPKVKSIPTDEYAETVTMHKVSKVGSFDIKKAKDGRFVFNLYSANKVIIATSQVYSSSQSALTGVKSVMSNAIKAQTEDLTLKKPEPKPYPKWEIYLDRAGEYRFRLNAANANCVCHAKAGYSTKASCKRAIESIIRIAETAEIDKSYIGEKK